MSEKSEKADKPGKPTRLKARLPRGLADRGPAEIAATRRIVETIRSVYERYGFEPVETPEIEYTDALGKFLPDQDRPNEGVFSFQDDDEQWLSLRYDLTAPLARYVAENFDTLPKPYRSYRFGWVFRNEKPGPGRFRQFMQFDADTVGSASPAADAEMCMMAADTMEALRIPRGSYVVNVSTRKILDGVMESAGLAGEQNEQRRLIVLRAIDKLERLGPDAVGELLRKGRTDESGDFTKGAELDENQISLIACLWRPIVIPDFSFKTVRGSATFATSRSEDGGESRDMEPVGPLDFADNTKTLEAWEIIFAESPLSLEGIGELKQMVLIWEAAGFGSKRIRVNPSIVRGLEYYTGPICEAELTFEALDTRGRPVRFGSVGGGGRYDGLVSRFRGEPVPATGFSIGVSRLAAALQHLGKLKTKSEYGPVVVTVFDKDRLADYQQMVAKLRSADIRAELYLGNPRNLGNQLKYADKRNAPCVVIQGSDEKAKGDVTIKDLIVGAELAKLEKGREEHLQKQAEAQFAVPEAELVDAVRKVLARHSLA